MDELALQLRYHRRIVSARVRSDLQYRASFATFLVAQAGFTGLELVSVLLTMRLVPDLGGWSSDHVAFLFGAAMLSFGFADVAVSMVENVDRHVRTGSFDRLLLRPVWPLVQVCAMDFEIRRVGRVIPPAAVLVWVTPRLEVVWSLRTAGQLVVMVVAGTVIYSSLWVTTAAASFWVIDARQAANAATYGGATANQFPLHVYRGWIRFVLGWIIPLGFVAYVPSRFLLDIDDPLDLPGWSALMPLPVAVASAAVATIVWRAGIAHYQSTGS